MNAPRNHNFAASNVPHYRNPMPLEFGPGVLFCVRIRPAGSSTAGHPPHSQAQPRPPSRPSVVQRDLIPDAGQGEDHPKPPNNKK